MYYSANRYRGKRRRGRIWVVVLALALLGAAAAAYLVLGRAAPEKGDTEPTQVVAEQAYATSAPAVQIIQPPSTQPAQPAVTVRGIYVTAHSAGIAQRMAHYIELCDTTEINALVIDIKDDRGQITYLPQDRERYSASVNIIPGIEDVMAQLKAHGIYAIARIVCFKDPVWSAQNPRLAIHTAGGGLWKDKEGNAWLDPYNRESWAYLLEIALLAAGLGFDEIQLDYVRFPTDGKLSQIDYGAAAEDQTKAQAIDAFVAYMRDELEQAGCRLSADIFGIAGVNRGDVDNLGQDFELLLGSADSLCPMVYPSHYANKRQNGVGQVVGGVLFEKPDLEPYAVVYNTLLRMAARMPEGETPRAVIRPYLQDFTASYLGQGYYQEYGATQVREQIQAVYDAGFEEWILWNRSGSYSEEALLPQ